MFLHRPFTALAIYPGLYTGISRRGCGCSRASIGLSWDPSSALQEDGSTPSLRVRGGEGAELGSARCSLNCTTRALFCLPSSGILIHGSAQAFKVSKTAEIVLSHFSSGTEERGPVPSIGDIVVQRRGEIRRTIRSAAEWKPS